MATPNERTLPEFIVVNNEPLNRYKLEMDGAYRWIDLTFVVNMTNGGNSPTFREDHIMNYFTAVGIRLNGKPYKFNQPLRFAVKKQTCDIGTPNYIQEPSAVANETYDAIVHYVIHFAENIHNENDISALLQTSELTNLELIISTGDAEDIASADAPTINSAKILIEVRDFTGIGRAGKDINNPDEEKMTDIFELVEDIDLESEKVDFRKPQIIDMVPGKNVLTHAGLVLDDGVASDELVTDIRTYNVSPRTSDLQRTFKGLVRRTKTEYKLENTIKGFFKIDWQEKLGRKGFKTGLKSKEQLQLLTSTLNKDTAKFYLYTKFV